MKRKDFDDGSRRDSAWDFQGFIGKTYEKAETSIYKTACKAMRVEDAIPLDNISQESDHLYAEIEEEEPPLLLPKRADTPIFNSAPDYPPYSSKEVQIRRSKSERKLRNVHNDIILPF